MTKTRNNKFIKKINYLALVEEKIYHKNIV